MLTQVAVAAPRDAEARHVLANALLHAGQPEAAAREYVAWLALVGVPESELAIVRKTLAAEGFVGQWRRLAAQTTKPGHHYKRATICAALGLKDDAFTALDNAFEQKESALVQLGVDPYLDPLRGDPRFTALLAASGVR